MQGAGIGARAARAKICVTRIKLIRFRRRASVENRKTAVTVAD